MGWRNGHAVRTPITCHSLSLSLFLSLFVSVSFSPFLCLFTLKYLTLRIEVLSSSYSSSPGLTLNLCADLRLEIYPCLIEYPHHHYHYHYHHIPPSHCACVCLSVSQQSNSAAAMLFRNGFKHRRWRQTVNWHKQELWSLRNKCACSPNCKPRMFSLHSRINLLYEHNYYHYSTWALMITFHMFSTCTTFDWIQTADGEIEWWLT